MRIPWNDFEVAALHPSGERALIFEPGETALDRI